MKLTPEDLQVQAELERLVERFGGETAIPAMACFIAHWFRMRQGPYVSRGEFLEALRYAWDRPLLQRVK